jgi:Zn-finger nucleic acid-binding protein
MIHKAIKITEVAQRYYKFKHPERKYSRHYSIRQWRQDKYIDREVVNVVLKKIFDEQFKLLKKK